MSLPAIAQHPVRYVLIGDGQSPHLLKWARTLHQVGGSRLELSVVSSRGLLEGFEKLIPPERRLLLNTRPRAAGGNASLLLHLPRLVFWLRALHRERSGSAPSPAPRPLILHAHYLTSHGTLAWLARRIGRLPALLVSSAWGSDILLAPQRSSLLRRLTTAVLKASEVCTADSQHMAREMLRLGAREVDVFPFGLAELPPQEADSSKDPDLYFSNRGLEPLYRIESVLEFFAAVAAQRPQSRLVVANDGGERAALEQRAQALGLQSRVVFLGRLEAEEQARWYERAQWYLSLPQSDSVAVSVLEALAHGCIPVLSDLPANRELVHHGRNGWILQEQGAAEFLHARPELLQRAPAMAAHNRAWIERHGLFAPQVRRFLADLLGRKHLRDAAGGPAGGTKAHP